MIVDVILDFIIIMEMNDINSDDDNDHNYGLLMMIIMMMVVMMIDYKMIDINYGNDKMK